MRVILFRGKEIDTGKWVEGDYCVYPHTRFPCTPTIIVSNRGLWKPVQIIPETVGQFTGLVDRNGVRIFEGDIVDHHVQRDILVCRGVINWDDKNAGFGHKLRTMNPSLSLYDCKAWEVVGNIYDNPELLKGEEE